MKLAPEVAPVLIITYQAQRVLLMPPVGRRGIDNLAATGGPLAALVIPGELAGPESRNTILSRLNPARVVVYGDPGRSGDARSPWPVPCQFTREGAVSLYLTPPG